MNFSLSLRVTRVFRGALIGEESIEIGKATATITDRNIYFIVVDPYGMDKLVMQARVIGRERS